MLPAIGTHKSELDTPLLCIDLDAMESNMEAMASWIAENGKAWRPHQKCHKTPAIAHLQRNLGALGVTCAKVSEAEVMIDSGIPDVLIANMVVGAQKFERLAALTRRGRPVVACDHFAQVEPLAEYCRRRGTTCRVIVEVDIGLNRVGVRPGTETLQLAQAIDRLPSLELCGIMGYEGHLLCVEDQVEKDRQIRESMGVLVHCRDELLRSGLCCDIVSAGGTGSYQITSTCEGVTELQAGGGIFGDPMYQQRMQVRGLKYALTVLATVVSRPALDRAVLDSGRKTLHPDLQMPLVKDHADARPLQLSAEHCQLELGPESRDLRIGDKLELIVGYADFTTVLHDHFYGFRSDVLQCVWPIAGRGKLQ